MSDSPGADISRHCRDCFGEPMEKIFGPGVDENADWFLKCFRCKQCGHVEPAILRERRLTMRMCDKL